MVQVRSNTEDDCNSRFQIKVKFNQSTPVPKTMLLPGKYTLHLYISLIPC